MVKKSVQKFMKNITNDRKTSDNREPENDDNENPIFGDGQAELSFPPHDPEGEEFNFSHESHEPQFDNAVAAPANSSYSFKSLPVQNPSNPSEQEDVVGLSAASELNNLSQNDTRGSNPNSLDFRHKVTLSKKIDLNTPLYPLDQERSADFENEDQDEVQDKVQDEVQDGGNQQQEAPKVLGATNVSYKEFELPQSLEEASIRLGDPNLIQPSSAYNAEFGVMHESAVQEKQNGPVITMSEPDLFEFSGRDRTKSQIKNETHIDYNAEVGDSGQPIEESAPEDVDQLALDAYHRSGSPDFSTLDAENEDLATQKEFVVVIESRNTKSREVKLTEEEFTRAEQQILENRQVHISGKVLVLDAIAISKQTPSDGSRRRRRSA